MSRSPEADLHQFLSSFLRHDPVCTERAKLPETFEEDSWRKLQISVRAVHQQQPVDQSFEELYKAVEEVCMHKLGHNLYSKLSEECERHIETEIAKLVCSPIVSCPQITRIHAVIHPLTHPRFQPVTDLLTD